MTAIEKINEAEKEAQALLDNARAAADEAVSSARTNGEYLVKKTVEKAEAERAEAIENARTAARAMKAETVLGAEQKCARLRESAAKRLDEAVKAVISELEKI